MRKMPPQFSLVLEEDVDVTKSCREKEERQKRLSERDEMVEKLLHLG